MSSILTAIQLNILGLGVVAGAHRTCIKARIPAPPLKLPISTVAVIP